MSVPTSRTNGNRVSTPSHQRLADRLAAAAVAAEPSGVAANAASGLDTVRTAAAISAKVLTVILFVSFIHSPANDSSFCKCSHLFPAPDY